MKRTLIPLLLALIQLASCTDPYLENTLGRAEALMEEHPDSSLALLRKLDDKSINTSAGKARYALDYAMALDKNWIDTMDVSIIEPAVKRYRRSLNRKERFLSRYYYARILENGESMEDAIKALYAAENSFGKGIDSVYLIRIAAARARIYAKHLIDDKAETALQEAIRLAQEQKDEENIQRMELSMADFYGANGRLKQKDSMLATIGAPRPGLELWKAESVAYLVFKSPGDSIHFMEDWNLFCRIAEEKQEKLEQGELVRYLLFRKRYDEALSVLNKMHPDELSIRDKIQYWWQLKTIYADSGNYKDAVYAQDKYNSAIENFTLDQFHSNLRSVEDRYADQMKRYRLMTRSIILSVIVVLLLGVLFWSRRQRKKMRAMLANLREEYDLFQQLRETELSQNVYFAKMLDERLVALKPYFTDKFPNKLYDSAELRRMTKDSKQMLSSIGFLFGLYHPKFVNALEDKGLSELELGYCCLFALGYTNKDITDKLQRTSFYNTNSDIRRKIGLGPHDTNLSIWIQNLYKECENADNT